MLSMVSTEKTIPYSQDLRRTIRQPRYGLLTDGIQIRGFVDLIDVVYFNQNMKRIFSDEIRLKFSVI